MVELLCNPVNEHRVLAGAEPRAVVVNVVVACIIVSGLQTLSVSAAEPNAAQRDVADVASTDTVVVAAVDDHRVTAEIVENASSNQRVAAPGHDDAPAPCAIETDVTDRNERYAVHDDQRL